MINNDKYKTCKCFLMLIFLVRQKTKKYKTKTLQQLHFLAAELVFMVAKTKEGLVFPVKFSCQFTCDDTTPWKVIDSCWNSAQRNKERHFCVQLVKYSASYNLKT